MRGRTTVVLALAAALALTTAACSKSSSSSGSTGSGATMSIGGQQANNHGSESISGKTSFDVEVDTYYFDPTVLKGTPGQQISLTFKNDSSTLHNFSVDSLGVDQDIAPSSDTVTVDVTLPSSGTLVFYCKYHKARGMLGEFTVS